MSPTGIACDPAANRIYAAYSWLEAPDAPAVAVIDGAADTVVAMVPMPFGLLTLACNPVAHKIYAGFESDSVLVIDGVLNQVVARIGTNEYPHLLASDTLDNRVACATCHFHAGADPRSINQLSPGANQAFADGAAAAYAPNQALHAWDFPFTGPAGDRTDNAVGSQGVRKAAYGGLDRKGNESDFTSTVEQFFE